MTAIDITSPFVGDGFHMLTLDELAAAMPSCQTVSMAGRRERDMRTPITPAQGVALACALEGVVA